ncbi:MAG: YbjN domain-containing protein [Candidatus Sericytochromatia bacterium]|nr:YbjN domain-containing protein [Candidatus Tanganyikabacteria bacterium]
MQFDSQNQEKTYQQVKQWATEIFGEDVYLRKDAPEVSIPRGSTMLRIQVHDWGEGKVGIRALSYMVEGAEIDEALMRFLLEKNDDVVFGGFGIDSDGDVVYQHSILATGMDKEEFRAAVKAVAAVADDFDDEIVSRWGGKRALER